MALLLFNGRVIQVYNEMRLSKWPFSFLAENYALITIEIIKKTIIVYASTLQHVIVDAS